MRNVSAAPTGDYPLLQFVVQSDSGVFAAVYGGATVLV